MSGKRGTGQPQCVARSKRSGEQCRNRTVAGATVCRMHGGGSPSRVRAGTRKMPGRPVTHGLDADPERVRWDALGEKQKAILQSPDLRRAESELSIVKAIFAQQFEELRGGKFDESSTPATWFLDQGYRVIKAAERVHRMAATSQNEALVAAILKLMRELVETYIPSERKEEADAEIKCRLDGIMGAHAPGESPSRLA